jgi:transcriptional regulator with XRE-family HTH domain
MSKVPIHIRHIRRMSAIVSWMSDVAVAQELGSRMAELRRRKNLTQAALAEAAGVSKRTVERLEKGQTGTQLTAFLRICRVLDLLDRFEDLVPKPLASPIEQLKQQGKVRKRARAAKPAPPNPAWTWGDEP